MPLAALPVRRRNRRGNSLRLRGRTMIRRFWTVGWLHHHTIPKPKGRRQARCVIMCARKALYLPQSFFTSASIPHRMSRITSFSAALSAAPDLEATGFSPTGLKRLDAALRADVDAEVIPGAVVLVMRAGRLAFFESFGYADR